MSPILLIFSCFFIATISAQSNRRYCYSRATFSGKWCYNGGSCDSATGQCRCPPSYSGSSCELSFITVPTDNNCNSNFDCRNGGSCLYMSGTSHGRTCQCASGFSGTKCEISITPSNGCFNNFDCRNGGTCRLNPRTRMRSCRCAYGFNGTKCEFKIPQKPTRPSCNTYCLYGASCFGSRCLCKPNYYGRHCEKSSNTGGGGSYYCRRGCKNGYCSQGRCLCNPGYQGKRCEKRAITEQYLTRLNSMLRLVLSSQFPQSLEVVKCLKPLMVNLKKIRMIAAFSDATKQTQLEEYFKNLLQIAHQLEKQKLQNFGGNGAGGEVPVEKRRGNLPRKEVERCATLLGLAVNNSQLFPNFANLTEQAAKKLNDKLVGYFRNLSVSLTLSPNIIERVFDNKAFRHIVKILGLPKNIEMLIRALNVPNTLTEKSTLLNSIINPGTGGKGGLDFQQILAQLQTLQGGAGGNIDMQSIISNLQTFMTAGGQGSRPQGFTGGRPQGFTGGRPQGFTGGRPQGFGGRPQGFGGRPHGFGGGRPHGHHGGGGYNKPGYGGGMGRPFGNGGLNASDLQELQTFLRAFNTSEILADICQDKTDCPENQVLMLLLVANKYGYIWKQKSFLVVKAYLEDGGLSSFSQQIDRFFQKKSPRPMPYTDMHKPDTDKDTSDYYSTY